TLIISFFDLPKRGGVLFRTDRVPRLVPAKHGPVTGLHHRTEQEKNAHKQEWRACTWPQLLHDESPSPALQEQEPFQLRSEN
ncbi:MAG TPA: hypothetical protein VGY66_28520, partial [Gemmataceae bacterium]|nr:hypothetical protein [Gemmataceae bacterium]